MDTRATAPAPTSQAGSNESANQAKPPSGSIPRVRIMGYRCPDCGELFETSKEALNCINCNKDGEKEEDRKSSTRSSESGESNAAGPGITRPASSGESTSSGP